MGTVQVSTAISGGGLSISRSVAREADGVVGTGPITLPVGYAGTLTTRTDDNTGTVTLAGGHAITTGMNVDIHWDGGVQYDVTVGTVSVNSMPFDLGVGDNLPSTSTAVVVTQRKAVNVAIDGDALAALGIEVGYTSSSSTAKSHIEFQDAAGDSIAELDLTANTPRLFDITGGDTNPFTGDPITVAYASNGSSSEVATLKIIHGADVTP